MGYKTILLEKRTCFLVSTPFDNGAFLGFLLVPCFGPFAHSQAARARCVNGHKSMRDLIQILHNIAPFLLQKLSKNYQLKYKNDRPLCVKNINSKS